MPILDAPARLVLTHDDARGRSDRVTDVFYDVHLDVRAHESNSFDGTAGIRFRCLPGDMPVFLDHDAASLELTLNGARVDLAADDGRAVLPDALLREHNVIEARFARTFDEQGGNLGFYRYGPEENPWAPP